MPLLQRLGVLGFVLVLLVLFVSACQGNEKSAFDLKIGDCIVPPELVVDETADVDKVTTVDCAELHDGEVVGVFKTSLSTYPGDEALVQLAIEGCPPRASVYFFPSETSWELADDREIACILESIFDLQTDDCLNYFGEDDVRRTSCTGPYDAQVLAVLDMPGDAYPGDAAIDDFALQNCPSATDFIISPSPESWEQGDRELICLDE